MAATLQPALVALAEAVAAHELIGAAYWYPTRLAESGQAFCELDTIEIHNRRRHYTASVNVIIRVADASTEDSEGWLAVLMDPVVGLPASLYEDATLGGAVGDLACGLIRRVGLLPGIGDDASYMAASFAVDLIIQPED